MNKKVSMFKLGIVLLVSFTINIWAAKPTVKISASPTSIIVGGSSTLTWTSTGATSVSINQGIGSVPVNGSRVVSPVATTTYTITAKNSSGTVTATAKVTVTAAPPTVSFSAAPASISPGQSSTLSWTTTRATSGSINQGIGTVALNGTKIVSPTATKTYIITVKGSGGTITAQATVTVVVVPPAVSFSADPTTIQLGESSTLTWTTTNATSATIDNAIGNVGLNSSITVYPIISTTYTITVSGSGGTVSASATITVNQPQPQVSLHAIPMAVLPGESSTLCWQTKNVDSTSIDNGIGPVPTSGSIQIAPAATTTYNITAAGPGGTTNASVTVSVDGALQPTVTIYSSLEIVAAGGEIVLSWNAMHAELASIDNGIGSVQPKGSLRVTPGQSTTYTITAENHNGIATASVKIELKSSPRCYAYVANNLDHTVSVVNTTYSGTVVKTIPVGLYPSGCAVAKNGMRVYVGNSSSQSISVIDTGSNSVVSTIAVSGMQGYLTLHPGGRRLYALAWRNDYPAMVVLDAETGQEVKEINLGGADVSGEGIVFHPDGSRLYVAGLNKVIVIDTLSNAIMFSIPVQSSNVKDLDFSHIGSRLYATGGNMYGDNVFVIDLATNSVIHTTCVYQSQGGQTAMLLAGKVLPDDSRLYVTADNDPQWKKLIYIDTSTFWGERAEMLNLYSPKSLAVHPNGSRVFIVGYYGKGYMYFFNTSSNASDGGVVLGNGSVAKGNFVGYMADTVAGKVTQNNVGVAGVTLTITGEGLTQAALTDANGNYVIALKNGTYSIAPSKEKMVFSPQNQQVTINYSASGKDFKVLDTGIPPTGTLSVSPATINIGGTTKLTWTSTNAATASIDNGVGDVPVSGSITLTPTATTTYKITISNTVLTATATAKVTVIGTVPTVTIAAVPATIQVGGSSTLTWTSTNATSASIDNGIGTVAVNGTRLVTPAATTTFKITVTGTNGSANASVTVSISEPPPIVTITATPDTIPPGGSATLTWTASNATSATIDQGIGNVQLNGSLAVKPAVETIYTITATGPGGTAAASITVKMLDAHLRTIWNGMKTAMISGNIDQSVSNFCEETREKYREIYTVLSAQLPQIATEMQDIELVYFQQGSAKYRIKRNELIQGTNYLVSFYIYFIIDYDGTWNIYQY